MIFIPACELFTKLIISEILKDYNLAVSHLSTSSDFFSKTVFQARMSDRKPEKATLLLPAAVFCMDL